MHLFKKALHGVPALLRGHHSSPFPAELEGEYQLYIGPEKVRTMRLAMLLAVFLVLPFAVLDAWALPALFPHTLWLRAALIGVCLATFAWTFRACYLQHYTASSVLVSSSMGLLLEGFVAFSGAGDLARSAYFAGLLLPIMGIHSFTFLNPKASTLITAGLLLAYLAIAFGIHGASDPQAIALVAINALVLISAASIGLLSQMGRDAFERQAFQNKRALNNELLATEHARMLIEHHALHDSLTGLPNRKAFEARTLALMQNFDAAMGDVAVLFIDLDGFKPVNDQFGHAVGDRILRAIGQRIQSAISDRDCVGRLGGDEFVVALLLPSGGGRLGYPAELARQIAERLRQHIAQPITIDHHMISVNASIGVALGSRHGFKVPILMAIADQVMYEVKRKGKGSCEVAQEEQDMIFAI